MFTSTEIRGTQFEVNRKGYNVEDVRAFLNQVAYQFEKLEKEATRDNYDETVKKWNAKNVLLRQMGLRTVLIPESIEY